MIDTISRKRREEEDQIYFLFSEHLHVARKWLFCHRPSCFQLEAIPHLRVLRSGAAEQHTFARLLRRLQPPQPPQPPPKRTLTKREGGKKMEKFFCRR